MDETLFTHGDRVSIEVLDHNGDVKRTLNNIEFNEHVLLPGESYNWQQYRSAKHFERSARPIRHMIDLLCRLATHENVKILTARADFDDMELFRNVLATHGIVNCSICHAGNIPTGSSGEKKAVCVSEEINRYGYKNAHLYDDSLANLTAFLGLRSTYPAVNFYAYHVVHRDGIVKITRHER